MQKGFSFVGLKLGVGGGGGGEEVKLSLGKVTKHRFFSTEAEALVMVVSSNLVTLLTFLRKSSGTSH